MRSCDRRPKSLTTIERTARNDFSNSVPIVYDPRVLPKMKSHLCNFTWFGDILRYVEKNSSRRLNASGEIKAYPGVLNAFLFSSKFYTIRKRMENIFI